MNNVTGTIAGIIAGFIGLAIVAVLVSQKASTSGVIGSAGSGLANIISAAVSPVTGNSVAPNIGSGGGGGGLGGIFGGGGGSSPLSMLGGGGFDPSSIISGLPISAIGGGAFGGSFL